MSVYSDYLQEKMDGHVRMKVFLKSQQVGSRNNITSKMLAGYINDFDEECVRLEDEECIILRHEIVSMKPDDGRDRDGRDRKDR